MSMAKRFIVKVQVPLFSSDGGAGVLVYNEDHSIMREVPLRSEKERKQLIKEMDGEPKGFFWATHDGKGVILEEHAPWQDW